jgi:deoxycytidylate deaminase
MSDADGMVFVRAVATTSTCARTHVGAAALRHGLLIATASNGIPGTDGPCTAWCVSVSRRWCGANQAQRWK